MAVTYRAEAPDQIIVERLGAIDALYQRRSGATHLVAAPVPQILEALGEGDTDVAGLLARLATRFDLDAADDEAKAALEQRLAELIDLGLVRGER
jgi:PqqD family protein of HPr-rel-A system